jgi:hypothetical protein
MLSMLISQTVFNVHEIPNFFEILLLIFYGNDIHCYWEDITRSFLSYTLCINKAQLYQMNHQFRNTRILKVLVVTHIYVS